MENNNRSKVRARLAYIFSAALIIEVLVILVATILGYPIDIPDKLIPIVLSVSGLMGTIVIFFFASESSREKPE